MTPDEPAVATDPVCGMTVALPKTRGTVPYEGRTYYFCSTGCHDKFAADPGGWLARKGYARMPAAPVRVELRRQTPSAGTPAPIRAAHAPTGFTCPMHPEVITETPGDCPICGMALEALSPTQTDATAHELADMTRRLRIS